jgi:ribulose-phosphate 3-epimerase
MDGRFVPNLSFGPEVVRSLRGFTRKPFDVHLMLSKPSRYLGVFARSGADHLSVHLECEDKPGTLLPAIRKLKKKAGICLKPRTPVHRLAPYLPLVDIVMVMTVEPGFGGQSFLSSQLEKVAVLSRLRRQKGLKFLIELDGGLDASNASSCWEAGADVLVAGTSVFGKKSYAKAIQGLRK